MICQVHFRFFSKQIHTLGARGFFLAAECFGSSAKVTSGELTWPKPEAAHEKSLTSKVTKAIGAININCKIQLQSVLCAIVVGDVSHALSRDQPL